MRFLVDECCPRAVAETLRAAGHDVRYAAESDRSVEDKELLAAALAEGRVVVTEDFDFGELLIRDGLASVGAIILCLPHHTPAERAARLADALADDALRITGAVTIVEARRVRQRKLDARQAPHNPRS